MRRHVLPTAFLSFAYLFAVALADPPPQPAAVFTSPPGATLDLRPPLAPPRPIDVGPTPDALAVAFEIVATKDVVTADGKIQTVEQTADHVEVIPGELLTLRLRGEVVMPIDGAPVPAIAWSISRPTGNGKIYPADGHNVTFSAPAADAGVYLFTAAVNNPDALGAPFMAARWVVVSGAQPPPKPDEVTPPKPPEPVKPSEPAAVTAVTYVYEKDEGEVPAGVRVALDQLSRGGILATSFEVDTVDGSGDTPEQYKPQLAAQIKSGQRPALVVMAGSTVKQVWHNVATAKDVLEAAK